MSLHTPTLFLMTLVLHLVIGCLFLHSWRQARDTPALVLWGASFLIGGLGSVFMAARFHMPDILSVGLGNLLLIGAFGLTWSGYRSFEGRDPAFSRVLLGCGAWCAIYAIPNFPNSALAWMAILSALIGIFAMLSARELWRGRSKKLTSRPLLTVLESAHASFYWLGIPMLFVMPMPSSGTLLESPTLGITCFGASFFCVSTSFLMMAMAKERAERGQRLAAETDALTGIANRRAFVAKAERDCRDPSRALSLLLFDLDHFKSINDTYGHDAGDGVLVAFAELAEAVLPQGASFGRIGGEEFACTLPGCGPDEAVESAERLRANMPTIFLPRHPDLRVRVSIGIAAKPQGEAGRFDLMMKRADAALYRAKDTGRNRVVLDPGMPLAA